MVTTKPSSVPVPSVDWFLLLVLQWLDTGWRGTTGHDGSWLGGRVEAAPLLTHGPRHCHCMTFTNPCPQPSLSDFNVQN